MAAAVTGHKRPRIEKEPVFPLQTLPRDCFNIVISFLSPPDNPFGKKLIPLLSTSHSFRNLMPELLRNYLNAGGAFYGWHDRFLQCKVFSTEQAKVTLNGVQKLYNAKVRDIRSRLRFDETLSFFENISSFRGDAGVEGLEDLAQICTNLTHLRISPAIRIRDEDIQGLSRCTQLQTLRIPSAPISAPSLKIISRSFTSLTYLDLGVRSDTLYLRRELPEFDAELQEIARRCIHLKSLFLDGSTRVLTDATLTEIGKLTELQELSLGFTGSLTSATALKKLVLDRDFIRLDLRLGVVDGDFMNHFPQKNSLRFLMLSKTRKVTIENIKNVIAQCSNLKSLILQGSFLREVNLVKETLKKEYPRINFSEQSFH